MKRGGLSLFWVFLFCSVINAQIVTTESQGLKRSSHLKIEEIKKTPKPKKPQVMYERQTFLIGGYSFHPSQGAAYVMAGTLKQFGFYGKLKTDFNIPKDEDGVLYVYKHSSLFIEEADNARLSLTGGGLLRVTKNFSVYAGIGCGGRWLYWNAIDGHDYLVVTHSYTGFETDFGVMGNFNRCFIQAGLQLLESDFLEINLGVGLKI